MKNKAQEIQTKQTQEMKTSVSVRIIVKIN